MDVRVWWKRMVMEGPGRDGTPAWVIQRLMDLPGNVLGAFCIVGGLLVVLKVGGSVLCSLGILGASLLVSLGISVWWQRA